MALRSAKTAASFVSSLGVNMHLGTTNYTDLSKVDADLTYLGLQNVRDSAEGPFNAAIWASVAKATGVKFDDYIGEQSQVGMRTDMSYITALAHEGILNAIEGGNEEDDPWPQFLGNTLQATAQFQVQLYALGHSLGLPVINMSFGQGWTSANDWHGNYDKVGNLSAIADYANGHVYPSGAPEASFALIASDAAIAAPNRPLINAEFGYDTDQVNQTSAAKYMLDGVFDAYKQGTVRTYLYALYDDQSGAYGLMNDDGTPRPGATALHNVTSLLTDSGSVPLRGFDYSVSSEVGGDEDVLLQKSDGSYWLALWNETAGAHSAKLSLGAVARSISIYDPLTSLNAVQTARATKTLTISIPDHPVLVEITPSPAASQAAPAAIVTIPMASSTNIKFWANYEVTIGQNDANPVVTGTKKTIGANAGNHSIFINGQGDTLNAIGGKETVQAYKGNNAITTGVGDDLIRFAGSGNRIDAGGGSNTLQDSGSHNVIVLPGVGQGIDQVYGYARAIAELARMRSAPAPFSAFCAALIEPSLHEDYLYALRHG